MMKIRDRNRKKEKSSRSQLRGKAPVRPPTANFVASAGGRMYNESTSCLYQQSGRMEGRGRMKTGRRLAAILAAAVLLAGAGCTSGQGETSGKRRKP
ncbi:MAG: hypothetical protein ACLU9S_04270 [Oscillospiraceae bacterium]